MTKSLTNELFTPYKEPEREFRSSRRHFKSLSLDELRSPDFNLFSDQEYSEDEEVKAMTETMEQYMSKTRTDYRSGVARPKIEEKDSFELKGQFLKELRENTFSGSDNEDANEHIEKVLEIILDSRGRSTETYDGLSAIQAQLTNLGREIKKVNEKVYVAQVGCEECKGPHYTKDFPLKEEGKTLKEAYYMQFGRPFQSEGYRATAPGFYQRNNANPSYAQGYQSALDPWKTILFTARAKIDVYKRKITLRVGINQGDDLMPTIEEGEVIEEFRTRDKDLDTRIDDYPSSCDDDKKIHIDFLEDMDAYCDEGMDDVIVGESFLREVGIKA
ncbi:hypothetical protein Tco_0375191 [Tanacetum coccineum]